LPGEGGGTFVHLAEPAADSFTLVGAASGLLSELWHGESVNFLAVTLSDLSMPTQQGRLDDVFQKGPSTSLCFAQDDSGDGWRRVHDRRGRASDAVDAIRDRYGDEAIMFGRMVDLGDEAPDRIGFRKTVGVDVTLPAL
jgi:hypothetical protein